MDGKSCCAPSREPDENQSGPSDLGQSPKAGDKTGMVELAGGSFLMGAEGPETWPSDAEGPVREVEVKPFWI
ncbi:MAG: SUMF1/EgtB/PvdO family nonheme iron enzyme, partial [Verrucomicrobiota bacterium]